MLLILGWGRTFFMGCVGNIHNIEIRNGILAMKSLFSFCLMCFFSVVVHFFHQELDARNWPEYRAFTFRNRDLNPAFMKKETTMGARASYANHHEQIIRMQYRGKQNPDIS